MAPRASSKGDGPMALGRAMALLRLLSGHPDGLNLSTLAAALNVPKSSLLSTLNGLTELGYLARSGALYVIGEETWSLASALTGARSLRQLARPVLERAVAECGETVLLAELNADRRGFSYIDFVESPKSIRFCARIGEQRPLYPTACGRLFLAHFPEKERERYFKSMTLKPTASKTIASRSKIEALLDNIRATDLSVTMGDYADDAAGFSAPIRNASNTIVAGLTIGAPLSRGQREPDLFSRIVLDSARTISTLLGHRSDVSGNASRSRSRRRPASAK
ncbi:IclR family transcriptional regulator [Afipia sp. P52-10]|uniref:IclR family transcriptional regulator n=1 Tax=Afipia sp. P52-10 TaxID=1429916 RepID=UPI00126840E2|nr:IclR family transcriptional regulator [Afipia sp. P52-10]